MGLRKASCLLVFAAALLVWGLEYRSAFQGLEYPDASDYAQLGRELARGSGFRSQQSFPFVLGWLADRDLPTAPPWPNLTRFPLPTLTRAASFAMLGPGDLGAVLPGGLFLAATATLVFALGRRLFGPLAGALAAAVFVTRDSVLGHSISGLTETGAGFFVTATALALVAAGDRKRAVLGPALALGLVTGLAFLQRSNLALLVPVAGLLLVRGPERRGWRPIVVALAAGALTVLPWLLHVLRESGSPFVQLTADRGLVLAISGRDPFFELAQPDALRLVAEHPARLAGGLDPRWLASHGWGLFGRGLGWIGPLFLVAGLVRLEPTARTVWLFALGGLLATVVLLAGIHPEVLRFYYPWTPLCLLLAVGVLVRGLGLLPGAGRWLPPAAAVLLIALGVGAGVRAWGAAAPPALQPLTEAVRSGVAPGRVVASDVSWRVAWYADRPSVRFLGDPAQLERLDREFVPIDAVVLRAEAADRFRKALPSSALAGRYLESPRLAGGAAMWIRAGRER